MLIILSILIILCVVIGASYAYWRLVLSQTGENEILSNCFNIVFQEDSDAINLQKAYPITDEEGMKLVPFTFTIQNKCASYASYEVNLELLETILEENRLKSEFIKIQLDEETPLLLSNNKNVNPTLDNAYASYNLTTGYLDKNEERTYQLRLWMDEDVTIEDDAMNKQLESKITITASYIDHMPTDYEKCVEEYGEDSIQCSIISQADTTGKCPEVLEDGTVNITDIEDAESLVCTAPDDYGTSYYYRGDVENNWVKFADAYWRIVRVNGDGSIRVVYAGDANTIDALPNKAEVLQNGYDDVDTGYTQIGESAYNSSYNDNAYVGYMYGTPGSSSYEETHANINDSTIKQYIDQWYKTNIEGAGYSSYVSDTLFCNDRNASSTRPSSAYTNLGYGSEATAYRWYYGPWAAGISRQYPRLKCNQKNDQFTVGATNVGNGALTYPVALLTTDEVYAAGGYNISNEKYYLYSGNNYWTMSPNAFGGSYPVLQTVSSTGLLGGTIAYYSQGIRPVINLKPNSLKFGDGTALNPYELSVE